MVSEEVEETPVIYYTDDLPVLEENRLRGAGGFENPTIIYRDDRDGAIAGSGAGAGTGPRSPNRNNPNAGRGAGGFGGGFDRNRRLI
jgi:hypothetical protein